MAGNLLDFVLTLSGNLLDFENGCSTNKQDRKT